MPLVDLGVYILKRGAEALIVCVTIILIVSIMKKACSLVIDHSCEHTFSEHWYTQLAVIVIALSLIAITIGLFLIIIS